MPQVSRESAALMAIPVSPVGGLPPDHEHRIRQPFDAAQVGHRCLGLQCESFSFNLGALFMALNLEHVGLQQWFRIAPQADLSPRLQALGFLPHESVRVLRRSWWSSGPMVVQLGNASFALRPSEARQVALEPEA